jgi:Fe-S cluster biosynthesis and repair protein YggX
MWSGWSSRPGDVERPRSVASSGETVSCGISSWSSRTRSPRPGTSGTRGRRRGRWMAAVGAATAAARPGRRPVDGAAPSRPISLRMARTVSCVKLGAEAEGLEKPPFKGDLGQRIFEQVSKEAWRGWLEHSKMLINEFRLDLTSARGQQIWMSECERYFFGDGRHRRRTSSLARRGSARSGQEPLEQREVIASCGSMTPSAPTMARAQLRNSSTVAAAAPGWDPPPRRGPRPRATARPGRAPPRRAPACPPAERRIRAPGRGPRGPPRRSADEPQQQQAFFSGEFAQHGAQPSRAGGPRGGCFSAGRPP